MLDGMKNFLSFMNDNWTTIVVIISLLIALYQKIRSFISKSNEKKIASAKAQIKEIVLKLITDAEIDYEHWNKTGAIKRSQVIQKIFDEYPILAKAVDQKAVIAWIDEFIDESLKELRKVIAEGENVQE